jgi:prepilin-type N-terminal cleavage/methylation domain-containing protein
MRPSAVKARRGFTLIELLLVITVIAILSSLSFGLFKAARSGNNKSKALGEIQALSMACENYKKLYGDYPCGRNAGSSENDLNFCNDLFDQLMGRKVLYSGTLNNLGEKSVDLVTFKYAKLPGGTSRIIKPLLSAGIVASNNDKDLGLTDTPTATAATFFQDPWGNPYGYRYRVLPSAGTAIQSATTGAFASGYKDWKAPGFLIVSCGTKYAEPATPETPPASNEYWDPSASGSNGAMTKSGLVPTTYSDETNELGPFRADNVVNWGN